MIMIKLVTRVVICELFPILSILLGIRRGTCIVGAISKMFNLYNQQIVAIPGENEGGTGGHLYCFNCPVGHWLYRCLASKFVIQVLAP